MGKQAGSAPPRFFCLFLLTAAFVGAGTGSAGEAGGNSQSKCTCLTIASATSPLNRHRLVHRLVIGQGDLLQDFPKPDSQDNRRGIRLYLRLGEPIYYLVDCFEVFCFCEGRRLCAEFGHSVTASTGSRNRET